MLFVTLWLIVLVMSTSISADLSLWIALLRTNQALRANSCFLRDQAARFSFQFPFTLRNLSSKPWQSTQLEIIGYKWDQILFTITTVKSLMVKLLGQLNAPLLT